MSMPSLDGATGWLNSEPLGPAELRGHVVLVNFWTLTCINWLRQEPYVRAWSQAYRDDGLVVIGVHTPEFSFEHERRPRAAGDEERAIDYPVAVDNDYAVWSAFDNHYWPALYFVDGDGRDPRPALRRGPLRAIRARDPAAARRRARARLRRGAGVEAEADWDNLRTPETYLGYGRGEHFASSAAPRSTPHLRAPRAPAAEPLGARGRVDDRARERRARSGGRQHRLPLPRARRAPRALRRSAWPIPFRVLARRRGPGPVARRRRRRGRQRRAPRRPPVSARARAGAVRERTLEITFLEPGAEAYVVHVRLAALHDEIVAHARLRLRAVRDGDADGPGRGEPATPR